MPCRCVNYQRINFKLINCEFTCVSTLSRNIFANDDVNFFFKNFNNSCEFMGFNDSLRDIKGDNQRIYENN